MSTLRIAVATMALEDEIVSHLNEVFGKDLKNLKKAKICLRQSQERLKEIRGKVSWLTLGRLMVVQII